MDYFKFDLQLFADAVVSMTGAGANNAIYWAKIGDEAYAWKTETEITTALTSSTVVIDAVVDTTNKKLIVKAVDGETPSIKATSTDNTGLQGWTFTTAKSFKTTADHIGEAEYPGTATACSVAFKGSGGAALGTVTTVATGKDAATSSTIAFDKDTAGKVVVSAGCTVGTMKATNEEATFTLADTASALLDGTVTVAKGGSNAAVVGTTTYTNKSQDNAAVLTATAGDTETTVTLVSGGVEVKSTAANSALETDAGTITAVTANAGVNVASATVETVTTVTVSGVDTDGTCKVELDGGKSVVIGAATYTNASNNGKATITIVDASNTETNQVTDGSVVLGNGAVVTDSTGAAVTVTNSSANAITVNKDGVVSNIASNAAFTVKPNGMTNAISYTATAAGIVVKDTNAGTKSVGIYTGTPATMTVDKTGAVKSGDENAVAAPITWEVPSAVTALGDAVSKPFVYLVANDGSVKTAPETTEPTNAIPAGYIGYFKVTTAWANGSPTVTVAFDGDGSVPGNIDAYAGKITVNATNLVSVTKENEEAKQIKTVTISSTISASTADDAVTVTNLTHGTDVTGADVANYKDGLYYEFATGVSYLQGITLDDTAGTYYYQVAFVESNGTVTVQLTDVSTTVNGQTAEQKATWLAANNYFEVTKTDTTASKTGSVKINYVQKGDTGEGRYSLYGMTKNGTTALEIPVNATAITYGTDAGSGVSSIDFDSRMTGAVNNVVLAGVVPGIKVTDGGTDVTLKTTTPNVVSLKSDVAYGYKNAITLDVTKLTYDATTGQAKVFVTDSGTADETTRIKTLTASAAASTNRDYGYYTITKVDGDGTVSYTVAYTAGSETLSDGAAVNLTTLGTLLDGKTAVDLNSTKDVAVTVTMTDLDKVVNAVQDGTKGLKYLTKGSASQDLDTVDETVVVWTTSNAIAYGTDGAISFDDIWSNGNDDTSGKHIYYYQVRKGAADKGVTTYTISDKVATTVSGSSTPGTNVDLDKDSYIIAEYTDATGAIVMTYHQGTTNVVTAAELAAIGEAVKVDGSTVDNETTTTEAITKKLTLTETIPCNVTNLPATVKTVDTKSVSGSDYAYKDTYDVSGSPIKLGTTNGTVYYKVNVTTPGSKENYGVNTATLTAVSGKPTDLDRTNYVKVETTGGNAISIQYLPATGADAKGKSYAYDFNGQKITVDPTGAAADATISIKDESTPTTDNAVFVIKNLSKGQHTDVSGATGATTSPASGDADQYTTSYAISYTGDGTHITATDGILLTGTTSAVAYYSVAKGEKSNGVDGGGNPIPGGVITYTVAYAADKTAAEGVANSIGYIKVENGTDKGITISYTQKDGVTDDLSKIGESIAINAKNAASTVVAIDLSNSGTTINYALKDMRSGVEVVNPGTNDTYAQLTAVDLSAAKLTLGSEAKAYWIVSADGTLAKTTTEPTDGETNYFSVVKTENNYVVKYVEAGNGTAFDLSNATLAVDASGVSTDDTCALNLSNATNTLKGYTVTGAPAGVTMQNGGTNSTISYTSTFSAWPPAKTGTYTYFTPTEDSAGKTITELATSSTPVTVAPEATVEKQKTFNKVTITVTGTGNALTYQFALDTATQGPKDISLSGSNANITTIPLQASIAKLDASGANTAAVTFTGLTTGDSVVNVQNGQSFSGAGTFTLDPAADGTAAKKFTQSGSDPIVVKYDGTSFVGVSGTFELSLATGALATLTGAGDGNAWAATDFKTATITANTGDGDGKVYVTFTKGKITAITGLDEDETLTVTNGDGSNTNTYIYTYDAVKGAGKITCTDSSSNETVAGADGTSVNVVALNYQAAAAPLTSPTFNWNGTGSPYYVSYSGTAATIEQPATAGTVEVTTGSYIMAEVIGNTLKLTPVTGTAAGTVNKDADFAGTITVNVANGVPVTYDKTAYANDLGANGKFTVAFTNVADGSTFTHLGTGDKVTTATLGQGATITLGTAKYTTAAADSTLVFEDGKIVSGTVTLTNESKTLIGANEKISITTGGDGVQVVFKDGAIQSITKFGKTVADGVITLEAYTTDEKGVDHTVSTTTYEATSDTSITKKVVMADGTTETSTLTIVKDADILKPDKDALTKIATAINMKPAKSSTGYIEVGTDDTLGSEVEGEAHIKHNTTRQEKTLSAGDNGTQFVRVTVTAGTTPGTDPYTVELAALVYKDGELTTTGADASKIIVKFDADDGSGNPVKISYNGESNSFKKIDFKNVANGSAFVGLSQGSTVKTGGFAATNTVTVNGTTYKASGETFAAGHLDFTIYAENSRTTYIVDGAVVATGEVVSVDTADATNKKYTLNYTTSSETYKNGVEVVYSDGVPAITGLEDGEKVTILNAKTNKTTTFERKGTYLYVTTENGTVFGHDSSVAVPAYSATVATFENTLTTGGYTNLTTKAATEAQFQWSDLSATPAKAAAGYFELTGTDTAKSATVADQSAKTSITYKDYGKTYVYASVATGVNGTLTLTKQTVGYDGTLTTVAFGDADSVTMNGIAGKRITYTRDANMKSLTLNGIGAGSSISGTAKDGDVITTATLAAATYKADGSVDKAAETVTVYTKTYTAGASTTMTFTGGKATSGAFLLSGTGAAATITAANTDSDSNTQSIDVTYAQNGYTSTATNDKNVVVTVVNGKVTSITGLNATTTTGATTGEQVRVLTTTTDKFGVTKKTTTFYTAKQSTETGKNGQIIVTRSVYDGDVTTDTGTGTTSTHTFANATQNILDSSAVWTTSDYVTKQDFDWTNTGYFLATPGTGDDKGKYTAEIAKQTTGQIDKDDVDDVYLEVVSTKASASSPAVISSMRLVKVNKDGSFSELTNATIGTVTINAKDATAGFELPTHTNKLVITNAQDKATYKGLNGDDTLAGTGTVTMNGTKYVAAGTYAMNGAGELTTGIFTITGEATGSAVPAHDGDNVVVNSGNKYGEVEKSIVYTAGADVAEADKGVAVTFTDGQITSVTGLNAGEKVVLTQVKGTAQATGMTTTISKDDDKIVTRSIAIPGISTPLVMTRTDNTDATDDVLAETNGASNKYVVSNKFDYGATTAGQIGLFEVNNVSKAASVAAQDAGLELTAGTSYVLVNASQASKNVTINTLAVFTDNAGSLDKEKGNTVVSGGVTIAAPADGNLTLAPGAEQLFTVYKWDADKKAYVEDTTAAGSEKARGYGIAVTGAVAEKTYTGFGTLDTVTGSLVTGDKITVGGKTLTLAGDNAILVRGDGKAINGVYTMGSGFESASKTFSDDTATTADFTTKISGATAAVVKVADGVVDSIKGVKANDTVQIVSTNAKTGAVSTTTYRAEAITGSTDLKITRTTVVDGVTTVVTGTVGATDSIMAASWGTPTATLTSKFDWTSASGSGYFLTEVTDTAKKLGTIEVKPATTTAEVGKYYLKVALSADGVVSGLSLHKIKADGTPDSDVISTVTEGTINVTAPTTALTLDMSTGIPAAVVFNVTGAAAKSDITMDNAKDTLTTATLAAGEYVTVNTKKVMAGASGALEFTNGALVNGTVEFDKETTAGNLAITTSKGTVTISDTLAAVTAAGQTAETPVVTVKNGVVTNISGITKYNNGKTGAKATTVAVVVSGVTATYSTDANKNLNVNLTGLATGNDVVTAALTKGATISVNGTATYTTAEAGAVTMHQAAAGLQLYEGAVTFNAGTTASATKNIHVTGASTSSATDDAIAAFTTAGKSNDITVKVEKGVITSVKGLAAGDVLAYNNVTYTAKSATVITKTYNDEKGVSHTDTAYLSAVGADIIGASYAVVDADTDITSDETFEGQFSWAEVSGRSTGYFKITEGKTANTATIAEQSTKSSPTAGKNKTVKYVKANTALDTESGKQILSIGAIQVTNNGTKTTVSETDPAKILTAGTKITVTAPTVAVGNAIPALSYTKAHADKYNVVINKAANGSAFAGLTAGDKVTTATLAAPVTNTTTGVTTYESVTMTDGKGNAVQYVAGAKGALEFIGEGASTETGTDSTNVATLLKGTIVLDANDGNTSGVNKTAILAGSADGSAANITLALDDSATTTAGTTADKVVVTVDKGVVKSITGLETVNNVLTLTPEGGTAVTYKVLYKERNYTVKSGTVTRLDTYTVMVERTEGTAKTYASFVTGKNIYGELNSRGVMTNGYKTVAADTPTNTDKLWSDTGKATQVAYAAIDTTVNPHTANFEQAATDAIKGETAERGKKYLAMTVKTTNGVTTIQKIEVAEVAADGSMQILKNMPVTNGTYGIGSTGVITINGTNGTSFQKINYTIPATVPVTMTNLAVGSVITGIKDHSYNATLPTATNGDQVSTADQTGYKLSKGSVTLYKVVDANVDYDNDGTADTTAKQTVETKVTYALKAKGDSATIDVSGGAVSKLTGLETNGESVTVVEATEKGDLTTVYAVTTISKVVYVTKTVTAVDGTKKVYKVALPSDAATYDWATDSENRLVLDNSMAEVVSNFDWTMDKKDTGYFVVGTKSGVTSATVTAQKKAVSYKAATAKDAAASYIALKISDTGVVESVKAMKLDTDTTSEHYGEMINATTKFTGTINVAAPTKNALVFDRSKVDTTDTIDAESAYVAVTGAIKGSRITSLALGDTVTTAKLAKAVYKNNAWTNAETVTLSVADDSNGTQTFTAGANGALGFKVQAIDGSNKLSLTGGTVVLRAGGYVYAGDRMITMAGGSMTVTASTSRNVTSYTVGDLKEGEVFTVETFGSGATKKKYMRSGNNLFCEITTDSGTTTAVYELKTTASVKSSVLELAGGAASKKNPWTTYTEANATFKDDEKLGKALTSTAKNAAVTVDLKTLVTRINADNNLYKTYQGYANTYGTNSDYTFVIDKYLANPAKFNGAASVINNDNLLNRLALGDAASDLQETIGTRAWGTKTYSAANVDIAQTIKNTKDWSVTGSTKGDTIIGSSSANTVTNKVEATTTITGGTGNDTITGGTAKEQFVFDLTADDQNVLNNFGNGKDSVELRDNTGAQTSEWKAKLVTGVSGKTTTADVLLWNDANGDGVYDEGENGVTLTKMGNGKAVAINGTDYYFGSAKATKAETFTFASGANYFANDAYKNTLAVSKTDSKFATAKTLGDTIDINLNEVIGDTDTLRYYGIKAVNASKTGNRVSITASSEGSTLTGGTYQSTLKGGAGMDSLVGGSGADTFWFESIEGQDTVSNYQAAKDAVYLKDAKIVFSADDTGDVILSANGTNVVISDSDQKNSVTMLKAADATKAVNIMSLNDDGTKSTLSYYVGASTGKKANTFTATLDKDMAFTKDAEGKTTTTLNVSSYYVGASAKADDTLKLSSGKTVVTGAKLNLNDVASHLSSIDIIDTAGLKKGSTIELIGRESGTYTLKGSNNVTENFNLSQLTQETTTTVNNVTITNLAVADVITLGANITATKSASGKNTIFTLKDDAGNSYGTLTVTGVAASKFTANSYKGTIKRS